MNDALILPKMIGYYLAGVAGILGLAALGLFLALGFQAGEYRWWAWILDYYRATGSPPVPVLVAGAGILVSAVVLVVLCPWELRETRYGKARWAKPVDVGRFKPSIRDRRGVVLGRFGGNILMADAPLSGLVSAPAGTGKTGGIIVPSILMSDGVSLIVNDPKGEAFETTAGYRAKLGPVFRVEWNRQGGSPSRFNPLDLGSLPADGAGRGDVMDRMAAILVEGDERVFWVSSGRLSLGAWLLFHIYEAEARGAVPTLSGALHAFMSLGRLEDAEDEQEGDAIAIELERCAAISEANGWPFRITSALRALAGYDYRTRANILGTVYAAMRVFLNDNVAEATNRSDFTLRDLRGIGGKPVTVYVVVPAFDQEAFGKVTALFVESATRFLTQKVPERAELQVRFILDEVGFLPPITAVSMGPAICRGYRVSFLFACQDYAQLRDKWGPGGLDNILTNTAFKVVLTQNNFSTAKLISDTIGNQTRKRESKSMRNGSFFGGSSKTESLEGAPLVRPEEILSLPFGRQLVLVQSYGDRPVLAKSAFFWKERRLKKRANLAPPALAPKLKEAA